MVSSIDGVIAKNSDEFVDWSSKEDKKYFSNITKEKGCLVMGSSTFKTIGRPLPDRHNLILTRDVIGMNEKYNAEEHDNLEFIKVKTASEVISHCKSLGFEEIVLGGGTTVNTLFASEMLIDRIHLSVEPIAVGDGLKLFDVDLKMDLKLDKIDKLNNNTVLLVYDVVK
jgi:dihydrofolate reductase